MSIGGSDTQDGMNWRSAKATIPAAYDSLPPCSINGLRWHHCGDIQVGSGRFRIGNQLVIESPYVWLRGRGAVVTELFYAKPYGCAILWTARPYNTGLGKTYGGGIFNLTLEGPGQTANGGNACGIETRDIVGFQMRGVSIQNFSGACWWDHAALYWNERFKVSAELSDCGIGWRLTVDRSDAVYPNATFGYGNFSLWINAFPGQRGIDESGGVLSYSNVHLIENMNGGTALRMRNSAAWYSNLIDIHFEGPAEGFDIGPTSRFQGVGPVDSGLPNSISGDYEVSPGS